MRIPVLSLQVSPYGLAEATERILEWAVVGESRSVCAANVHMVMEAHDDPEFAQRVNGADLVTPDGMPVAWALRIQGIRHQQRVSGPELMLEVCRLAALQGIPVGFHGGKPEVLEALTSEIHRRFPSLFITYAVSPPFRPLSEAEEAETRDSIRASGIRILFVGLGCPRQERWMARHRGILPAVMLGVGAAFDFHAGTLRKAPLWMQRAGLEWAFRLAMEPRRLFWRYFKHNPRFILLLALQLLRSATPNRKPLDIA
jgi:N-acetylglucosaminyldiphosphoundecaprenol N-acetyl-beta-D-mannosaminyltransferase